MRMREEEIVRIGAPLDDATVRSLMVGTVVSISGTLLTARDAAHKRLCEAADAGEKLPVELEGQVIYYVGPTPAKPGQVIGSAGPTTAYRMDPYAPKLMSLGVKGMIGKGRRSQEVIGAMQEYGCVYFAAVEGAAALIAKTIKAAEVVAYEDLGAEAIRRLEVQDFPAIVANDVQGGDLYEDGVRRFLEGREA